MDKINKILQRQLNKYIKEDEISEEFKSFIESVNSAYNEFEKDRLLLERSLEISEKEYNDNLLKIEKLQGQIIHQEKMAGMGQLSAGIAHEINNPLGFVKSNVYTLSKYKDKIKGLLDLYFKVENFLEIEDKENYDTKFSEVSEYKKIIK